MKATNFFGRRAGVSRNLVSLFLIWTFVCGSALAAFADDKPKAGAAKLNEDQRILHVLNRLGFGARPGDVERVKKMGLNNYIEQQLNPQTLDDAAVEGRLRDMPTLNMPTPELFAKYPNPGAFLRVLQRQGNAPEALVQAREQREKGKANAQDAPNVTMNAPANGGDVMEMSRANNGDAMNAPNGQNNAQNNPNNPAANPNNAQYRAQLMQYYRENGLQFPQRITQELNASRIIRGVYSERQLQETMVDFWSNHFNIYANKGADKWYLTSYDRDVIRPNALGNFRDLLVSTAQSPAMLFYLDNFQSVAPNANVNLRRLQNNGGQMTDQQLRRQQRRANNGGGFGNLGGLGNGQMRRNNPNNPNAQARRQQQTDNNGQVTPNTPRLQNQQKQKRGINENYARELMELHTLGVEGGYTQKDVQEVARCFTGWTIIEPLGYRTAAAREMGGAEINPRAGSFTFIPQMHDDDEKIVLGQKIPAGGGINDGLKVIEILSRQPATAKFIATKLARKFVMDEPTPALVNRIANAYLKSNADIKTTLRATFTSPEFNAPENYRAKIKTPFELLVSSIRTLGGETDGGNQLQQWLTRMGEPLYGYIAPTGYPDKAENWVNTGGLLERLNFGLALTSNRIRGTRVDLARYVGKDAPDAAAHQAALDKLLGIIVQGDVSAGTRATLLQQMQDPNVTAKSETAANQTETAARMEANGDNAEMTPARANGGGGNGGRRGMRGGRLAMFGAPSASPEIVKLAGLILGSPEFQRQ